MSRIRFSLTNPLLPVVLGVVAVVSVVAATWSWNRARRKRVVRAIAPFASITLVLCSLVEAHVGYHWPWSFDVWATLPVAAVVVARVGWNDADRRRHVALVLTVVTSMLLPAVLINSFYAYFPTVGSIFGHTADDQVSTSAFLSISRSRAQAVAPSSSGSDRPVAATPAKAPSTPRAPSRRMRGVVIAVDLPGVRSGFRHRRAHVYLPPAWFDVPRPALPVVLVLSGTPGNTGDWTRAGSADRTADRYALAHGGFAPILVFADHNGSAFGDTECVDRSRAAAETYLISDVRDAVITTFQTSSDPRLWSIVGSSEGGTCALVLALRHPDLFGSFADLGGDLGPNLGGPRRTLAKLFANDPLQQQAHDPIWLMAHSPGGHGRPRGYFDVGTQDSKPRRAARILSAVAAANHYDVSVTVRPGRHNFRYWRRAFGRALTWLGDGSGVPGASITATAQQQVAKRSAGDGREIVGDGQA